MAETKYNTIISAVDEASEQILKIEERLKSMGKAGAAANKMMSPHLNLFHETMEQLDKLGEKFVEIGKSASEMGARFGEVLAPLGALGVVGSVGGVVEMTHAFAENTEQLEIAARAAGTTINAWQRLSYAANQAGMPIDALQHGLGIMSKNLGNAAVGKNKDLVSLMHYLGVATRDASGHLLSSAQILPQIADALSKAHNSTLEAAWGNQIFGRSYEEMLPILALGKKGINELQAAFDKYAYQTTDEDVETAKKFNESWKNMQTAVSGLTTEIGAKLSPVLQPLVQQVADWTAANRDWISTDLGQALEGVSTSLEKIDLKSVIDGMEKFGDNTLYVIDNIGGLQTIIIGAGLAMTASFFAPLIEMTAQLGKLAFAMGAPMLEASAEFVAAFGKMVVAMGSSLDIIAALDVAVATNPLGALVVAATTLAGLGLLVVSNWKTVSDFFDQLGDKLKGLEQKFQDFEKVFGIGDGATTPGHYEKRGYRQVFVPGQTLTLQQDQALYSGAPQATQKPEGHWVKQGYRSVYRLDAVQIPDGPSIPDASTVPSLSAPDMDVQSLSAHHGTVQWFDALDGDPAPGTERLEKKRGRSPQADSSSSEGVAPSQIESGASQVQQPIMSQAQLQILTDALKQTPVKIELDISYSGFPGGLKTTFDSDRSVTVVQTDKGYSRMANRGP